MKGITRLVFFPDEGVMDRSVGTALLEKTHSQIHNCKIILLLIIIMHSNFHTKEEGFKIYKVNNVRTHSRGDALLDRSSLASSNSVASFFCT